MHGLPLFWPFTWLLLWFVKENGEMGMTRICFLNSLEMCCTFTIGLFWRYRKKKSNEQIVTPGSTVYIILSFFFLHWYAFQQKKKKMCYNKHDFVISFLLIFYELFAMLLNILLWHWLLQNNPLWTYTVLVMLSIVREELPESLLLWVKHMGRL